MTSHTNAIDADLLRQITTYHVSDLGQQWVSWAWTKLADAGHVPAVIAEESPSYPDDLVTLATLGYLMDCFTELSHGGDVESSIAPPDISDRLSEVAWGRLAERHGIEPADGFHEESAHDITNLLIQERLSGVRSLLTSTLGLTGTYLSLIRHDDDTDPVTLPPAAVGIPQAMTTGGEMRAWEWLAQ